MIINPQNFGNNLNAFYNFKRHLLDASRSLHLASLTINPSYKGTDLNQLEKEINELKRKMDSIQVIND